MSSRGLTLHRLGHIEWRQPQPRADTPEVRAQQFAAIGLMVGGIGLFLNLAADKQLEVDVTKANCPACPPCNCSCGSVTGDDALTQSLYFPRR